MFNIKGVRPLFTGVITTAKRIEGDMTTKGGLLIDTTRMEGSINPFQTVYAVGNTVHDVAPGEIVKINFKRYAKAKHVPGGIGDDNIQHDNLSITYEIPYITINDTEYLFIQNNDIEYVVTDFDVDEGGLLQ